MKMLRSLSKLALCLAAGLATPATPASILPSADATAPEVARVPAKKASLSGIPVHTELALRQWLRPGEFIWNDDGVPKGRTDIVVNLKGRVMSVYRSGYEIGRSSIIYGADDKPTPAGTYPILQKRAKHVSSIYGTPMPYMMRLTWDGVSLHAAKMADDLGTNGCVGLPHEFATLVFEAAKVGDRVVIWEG
jgi:lipoprotein-anchoring transpeptidase ErfK/SrfK